MLMQNLIDFYLAITVTLSLRTFCMTSSEEFEERYEKALAGTGRSKPPGYQQALMYAQFTAGEAWALIWKSLFWPYSFAKAIIALLKT